MNSEVVASGSQVLSAFWPAVTILVLIISIGWMIFSFVEAHRWRIQTRQQGYEIAKNGANFWLAMLAKYKGESDNFRQKHSIFKRKIGQIEELKKKSIVKATEAYRRLAMEMYSYAKIKMDI